MLTHWSFSIPQHQKTSDFLRFSRGIKREQSNSHLPKKYFICFNESPLKMMKNVFYVILKSHFVLKVFNFLS